VCVCVCPTYILTQINKCRELADMAISTRFLSFENINRMFLHAKMSCLIFPNIYVYTCIYACTEKEREREKESFINPVSFCTT